MSELQEQLNAVNEPVSMEKLDKKLTIALIYLCKHETEIEKIKCEKDSAMKWALGGFISAVGAFIWSIFTARHS
jgi:hypothetical protein